MTTEELRLILDTLTTVSDNASVAVIVWIALHYSTQILTAAIIVGGIAYGIVIVSRSFSATNEWAQLGKSVSAAYGGSDGLFVTEYSKQAIQRAIQKAEKK